MAEELVIRGEGRAGGPSPSELMDRVKALQEQVARNDDRIVWFQEIGTALGQHWKEDELLTFIMERVTWIMDAERATLFLLDEDGQHIWSRVVSDQETREIRLRLGEGIAGWVAQHGKSINVKDAYKDARFNREWDAKTGYRTQSVLCQPMRNNKGVLIGVIQVLNKRRGYFTVEDEHLLSSISNTASIVIENNRLYFKAIDRNLELMETKRALEERIRDLDTLFGLQRAINEADDLEEMLQTLARASLGIIPSNGCFITIKQSEGFTTYCLARVDGETRFWVQHSRKAEGTSLRVMRAGEPYFCNTDCAIPDNPIYDTAGLDVRSVLAVPLYSEDTVLGAIKLLNRRLIANDGTPRGFDEDDLKLLTLIGGQVSTAVSRSIARERRQQEDRLSAIGRMLSGIVHDLKTPMAIARGYVQLMARADDRDKRDTYAESINRQFELLKEMTSEVLAYARGDSTLYLRTVHMHVFVDELEELLTQEFASYPVELDVSADYRGDVRMDDGKIKRVLFNLARNAREAMPDGGTYRVQFTREDDELVIACTDTGVGIPPEVQARIFEAFVTGRKSGTGLGLAIVKKLIEEHHGTIGFESTPGEGTTFRIRLPLQQPSNGEPEAV